MGLVWLNDVLQVGSKVILHMGIRACVQATTVRGLVQGCG